MDGICIVGPSCQYLHEKPRIASWKTEETKTRLLQREIKIPVNTILVVCIYLETKKLLEMTQLCKRITKEVLNSPIVTEGRKIELKRMRLIKTPF
jgi:hypothetical protein